MSKMCYNYESGQYELISENGYSYTQGCYVNHWDNSEYEWERYQEEEERRRREEEEEERRRREEEEEEQRRRDEEEQRRWEDWW